MMDLLYLRRVHAQHYCEHAERVVEQHVVHDL